MTKSKKELSLSEKKEKLKKLMNEKNRDYKGTVLKFASSEVIPDRLPFGVKVIDDLIGGGISSKRYSILWGQKGLGKTTLSYMLIANAQKQGKLCAFIDMERSYSNERASYFGVNTEDLVLATEFDTAEQAMDIMIEMAKEKVIDLIILDSVQALSPTGERETKKHKEKSVEEDTVALLARKLSQFFRMSASAVYKGNVAILLIGQSRMDLGGFIAIEKMSAGRALAHWSSLTLQIRRGPKSESPTEKMELEELDEKGKKIKVKKIVGFQAIIKLEKVKMSGCKVEGSDIRIPFLFSSGFSKLNEINNKKE